MIRGNQRGFTGVEILAVVAVVLLVPIVMKTGNPFDRSADPANRRTASAISGKDIVEITNQVAESEKPVTVKIDRSVEASSEVTDPKLTLSQKVGRFFAGLTTWTLVFLFVSLAFFGGAPIVWLWRKYANMKETMKRTVQAIRELDDDTYKRVAPKLSDKMDKKHKKTVDKLKMELN